MLVDDYRGDAVRGHYFVDDEDAFNPARRSVSAPRSGILERIALFEESGSRIATAMTIF